MSAVPTLPVTRRPMGISLGPHVEGVCLPRCDTQDPLTTAAGAQKRMVRDVPPPAGFSRRRRRAMVGRLSRFVRLFLNRRLKPLDKLTDVTIEHWLSETNYTDARKKEILECAGAHDLWDNVKYYFNKCFVKEEFYEKPKFSRCISSRTDHFKALTGPYFHAIEKAVLALPEFVKFVSVVDRPEYIMERVHTPGSGYYATDFTSWESLLTVDILNAVEMQLYDYMLQDVHRGPEVAGKIRAALAGENVCSFKWFKLRLHGSRMSGDMCTSLGNGFTNMIICSFLAHENGGECVGVFEGDDGLMRFVPERAAPTREQFLNLGFDVKMVYHREINTASFCGIIFDIEDRIGIADPRRALATFGWAASRYAKAKPSRLRDLLYCKAMSMVAQFSQCPILGKLGRRVLEAMGKRDVRKFVRQDPGLSWWEREHFIKMSVAEMMKTDHRPPPRTRMLVEEMFGISIKTQLQVEEYLDAWDGRSSLHIPGIVFPEEWTRFSRDYVITSSHPESIGDAFVDHAYSPQAFSLSRADYADPLIANARVPQARSAVGRPRASGPE